MNSYSLSSDSRRWWWPSALAGTASAAAITAMVVLPGVVQAAPEPLSPAEPARSVFIGDTDDRQCFMFRSPWNEALDGVQPRCPSKSSVNSRAGARRSGLSYLPCGRAPAQRPWLATAAAAAAAASGSRYSPPGTVGASDSSSR